MVRGRRLDLGQRRPLRCTDPDDDPVSGHELRRVDHRGDLALPEQEDRVVAERERLVAGLADEQAKRTRVAARDVDRDRAAADRAERASEEVERLCRLEELRAVVSDERRGLLLDLGERRVPRCAHVHPHEVSGRQVPGLYDGRNAVRQLLPGK